MRELIFKAGQKVRETAMEASSRMQSTEQLPLWAGGAFAFALQSVCGGQVIGQVIAV